jgi:hypothetical protein
MFEVANTGVGVQYSVRINYIVIVWVDLVCDAMRCNDPRVN